MAQIDVLPRALGVAARAVRDAAPDADVRATELGEAGLTAALHDYLRAWSAAPLLAELEECARSLAEGASSYVGVESLLVPRALR